MLADVDVTALLRPLDEEELTLRCIDAPDLQVTLARALSHSFHRTLSRHRYSWLLARHRRFRGNVRSGFTVNVNLF